MIDIGFGIKLKKKKKKGIDKRVILNDFEIINTLRKRKGGKK